MGAVTMSIDQKAAPGNILRVGDRVNIIGMLSVNGGKVQAYRIIKALKVLAIGGRGMASGSTPRGRGMGDSGMRSYRSITVEMNPVVSLQWANVRSYIRGMALVELCSKRDRIPDDAGVINPALSGLTKSAAGAAGY